MKHCILAIAALFVLASSADAQQPGDDAPLSDYLRRSFAAVSKDLVAAVEIMPEQDFGFRPGDASTKVRTFAAIVHHTLSVNSWMCSMGDGKPDPVTALGAAPIADKARLLELLKDTNTRCSAYLATLTDATLAQVITSGPAGQQLQAVRGNAVVFAIAHANEHYGNLVTYLRAKGLVPPATPSQVAPVKRAAAAK